MNAWWEALDIAGRVFACIAIPSSVLLVIQIILTLLGIGMEGDVDVPDADGDGDVDFNDYVLDDGFRFFTVRGIIAFLAVMGWTGLTMLSYNNGLPLSLTVAVLAGFAAMLVVAWMFRVFMKLQNDGTADIKNAVGKVGTVYLTVPPSRKEKGKVNVVFQERLIEVDAVTDGDTPLTYGTEVLVVDVSGLNTVVVKRLEHK